MRSYTCGKNKISRTHSVHEKQNRLLKKRIQQHFDGDLVSFFPVFCECADKSDMQMNKDDRKQC